MSVLIWVQESYAGNYLTTCVCVCVCGRRGWGSRRGSCLSSASDVRPSDRFSIVVFGRWHLLSWRWCPMELVLDWFCYAGDTGRCFRVEVQVWRLHRRLRLMSPAHDEASGWKGLKKMLFLGFFFLKLIKITVAYLHSWKSTHTSPKHSQCIILFA